jgi:hypothetical protein
MKGSAMNRQRIRTSLSFPIAIALLVGAPSSALAEEFPIEAMLSEAELGQARAGFTIEGIEITLGADLRTYIDGELALQTIVSWVGDTRSTERWVSDALTPADAEALDGMLANGHIAMRVNDQDIFLANDGQTALLQRTDGGLQNLVFNTANGVDLRQEADIAIGLANFEAFQSAIAPSIFMSGINDAMNWSASGANGP